MIFKTESGRVSNEIPGIGSGSGTRRALCICPLTISNHQSTSPLHVLQEHMLLKFWHRQNWLFSSQISVTFSCGVAPGENEFSGRNLKPSDKRATQLFSYQTSFEQ